MSREYLAIYLNDHLAGSLIAIEILEHLETEASDSMPDLPALKAVLVCGFEGFADLLCNIQRFLNWNLYSRVITALKNLTPGATDAFVIDSGLGAAPIISDLLTRLQWQSQ